MYIVYVIIYLYIQCGAPQICLWFLKANDELVRYIQNTY